MKSEFVKKWSSQVKKGTLSFIVLNILREKELYGYELIEEVKKYTAIEIAEGTLYPILIRLKKEELVTSKWIEQETGIPRKYYKLSDKGMVTLNEMREYWNALEEAIKRIGK